MYMSNASNIRSRLVGEFEKEGVELRDESGEVIDGDNGVKRIELHGVGNVEDYISLYKKVCSELGVKPDYKNKGETFILTPKWQ